MERPTSRAAVAFIFVTLLLDSIALGIVEDAQRELLGERVSLEPVNPIERGEHTDDLQPLWEEMTMVRRSAPGAAW